MIEGSYSRRDFLKMGTVGLAVATGLGFVGNIVYKEDREVIQLGELLTSEGIVVDKQFVRGGHENPLDDLDPFADLNLKKQLTKSPDKYEVKVVYEHGTATVTATVDDRELFDNVGKNTQLTIEFREAFKVRTTYKGELL